ncbi:unnamed protein product [Heligmosomoides polygyrus]|uniref:EF-hand domain-containing protein n=1 Tax=Heligmosomoides polygyrus TaxID=6339 RepID=A0A183GV62_HELPZ|nr:unnamed protein product [Heligmosomoides polygyrus]
MARSVLLTHYVTAALLRFKTNFNLLCFLKTNFIKLLHSLGRLEKPVRNSHAEHVSEERFLRVDQNKDKKLDFNEFLHMELAYVDAKREEFDSLDKDKDGIVTQKEYEEHYHGVTSRSEARRTEYFAQVFQDFDEDFDMSLSQDELERVLAERFLVKPRENFPKLFYSFDRDHSGGLDLTEYMKFDSSFPFEQTDPISLTSKRGRDGMSEPILDAKDAEAIAQVMAQGSQTLTHIGAGLHPVEPGPSRAAVPIVKLAKVSKAI